MEQCHSPLAMQTLSLPPEDQPAAMIHIDSLLHSCFELPVPPKSTVTLSVELVHNSVTTLYWPAAKQSI